MTRLALFGVLAAVLVAYAFWIYLRVELRVPAGRWLALVRGSILVVVLLLLFNPRLPVDAGGGAPARWVLLDASLSMSAVGEDGTTPWEAASRRADELEAGGWTVVRFGDDALQQQDVGGSGPDRLESRLAPALAAAAEAGVREVRVLSDARLEDAVAVRSALESLPLDVGFEGFASAVTNAGIGRFEVPDVSRADGTPVAELDVLAEDAGDSITVEIREEGRPVATVTLEAPSPGLRTTTTVELPTPEVDGRVRYSAHVVGPGDGFPDDDTAVAYANVGFESGGVVLISVRPDWEPRFLLPVLEEVTGLSAGGYLRAGPDRYLPVGTAVDRGEPVDSATVRRAADEAALLVVHGVGRESDAWVRAAASSAARRLLLPDDPEGAALAGLDVRGPRGGEWYVSPDVPTSPIAGALVGATLEGLPPLSRVLVPEDPLSSVPLQLQLRGAGPPESAFALVGDGGGRAAAALASGFWRWAMREGARDTYRGLWSGVAGWLLADRSMASAQPRPVQWVFGRSQPLEWRMPADSGTFRVRVESGGSTVADTLLGSDGAAVLRPLPPGAYEYVVLSGPGEDTIAEGRFDVASTTLEMLPRSAEPRLPDGSEATEQRAAPAGPPLRTTPWPYLLVIVLLCGEWIVRRRSGLR